MMTPAFLAAVMALELIRQWITWRNVIWRDLLAANTYTATLRPGPPTDKLPTTCDSNIIFSKIRKITSFFGSLKLHAPGEWLPFDLWSTGYQQSRDETSFDWKSAKANEKLNSYTKGERNSNNRDLGSSWARTVIIANLKRKIHKIYYQ